MPSIASSQKSSKSFIGGLGDSRDDVIIFEAGENVYKQFAEKFVSELEKNIKTLQVTASGNLVNSIRYDVSDDGKELNVFMADYYDYPNKGVKGVRSSKNAAGSPYQYKSYGMNAEGRASIKKYIESGHAKIKTVQKTNDKALGFGLEKKSVSLVDAQTETLIYLIKKYGIKKTNYFDKAVKVAFTGFGEAMAKAMGKDIAVKIITGNGNNN
jgi:hypothetical protein